MSTPPPSAAPPRPSGPPPTRVSATLKESNAKQVVFDFNPQKIAISHSHQRQTVNTSNQGDHDQSQPSTAGGNDNKAPLFHKDKVTEVGATTITLSDILFNGDSTVDKCKMLLGWSYPNGEQGSATQADVTKLTFTWGTAINYSVTMVSVDVTYDRFTFSGKPIRAKVNLKMRYEGTTPPGTNPTSGGIPGRRRHTLVAGETLQHIATANYGRPGAWRALATANGIEDPLAIQPGTLIYLPARSELADGARP